MPPKMSCQAYNGPRMQQNKSNQQVGKAKPKEKYPFYRLVFNRLKEEFCCPFGRLVATQGGALDGI